MDDKTKIAELEARIEYLEKAHLLRDGMENESGLMFGGEIGIICNDVFAWACSDFEALPQEHFDAYDMEYVDLDLSDDEFAWYPAAWAVRLRKMRPQKAAIDKHPIFHEVLTKMGIDYMSFPPGYGWPEGS